MGNNPKNDGDLEVPLFMEPPMLRVLSTSLGQSNASLCLTWVASNVSIAEMRLLFFEHTPQRADQEMITGCWFGCHFWNFPIYWE